MNGHDESEFEGIWYPTFVLDKNQMFLSQEKYMTTTDLSKTVLTISISETSFYIQNHQVPIAKQPEIVFHNLLFTIVCLEIFGLVFLIFKLILIPLVEFLLNRGEKHHQNIRVQPRHSHIDHHEMKENHWVQKTEHAL
jgi:frataxin-like iron-binding protein CyaY